MESSSWREDLSVGDAHIDAQHRSILFAADRVRSVLAGGEARELRLALAALRRVTVRHFVAEEALLSRLGHPDLEAHRAQHTRIGADLLEAEARAGQAGGPRVGDLEPILNQCLEHLAEDERILAPRVPEGMRGEERPTRPFLRAQLGVDEDHHALFAHIDRLEEALAREEEGEALQERFREVLEFIQGHFRREELLMELSGFPGSARHREAHHRLLEVLSSPRDPATAWEFLRTWSLEHLLGDDLVLAGHLHPA